MIEGKPRREPLWGPGKRKNGAIDDIITKLYAEKPKNFYSREKKFLNSF